MQIAIGKMKYKMTIEEKIVGSDAGGGTTEVWQAITSNPDIYVDIVEITVTEQAKFSQILRQVTHKIITRYSPEITTNRRLTDGVNNFQIKAIENIDANNRFLICYLTKL